jgi:hypothetical protein
MVGLFQPACTSMFTIDTSFDYDDSTNSFSNFLATISSGSSSTNFTNVMSSGSNFLLATGDLFGTTSTVNISFMPALTGTPGDMSAFAGIVNFDEAGLPGGFFTGTVTAVPTPALLPGLIGIGVAALRKKQGEESEQEA